MSKPKRIEQVGWLVWWNLRSNAAELDGAALQQSAQEAGLKLSTLKGRSSSAALAKTMKVFERWCDKVEAGSSVSYRFQREDSETLLLERGRCPGQPWDAVALFCLFDNGPVLDILEDVPAQAVVDIRALYKRFVESVEGLQGNVTINAVRKHVYRWIERQGGILVPASGQKLYFLPRPKGKRGDIAEDALGCHQLWFAASPLNGQFFYVPAGECAEMIPGFIETIEKGLDELYRSLERLTSANLREGSRTLGLKAIRLRLSQAMERVVLYAPVLGGQCGRLVVRANQLQAGLEAVEKACGDRH
ncbi:MAG: hypothetical protein KAY24_00245 [Candidatus Eisenbacteria sp.]|nr:hypothetical protein [Candidatus Eisenbacteria bacterium]